MKTVAVYFTAPGALDYPFDEAEYRTSFRELGEEIARLGGRMVIVRSMATYLGRGTFSRAWESDCDTYTEIQGPLSADLVLNRGNFSATDCPMVNDPELWELCTDKWKTYEAFPALHPKMLKVTDTQELEAGIRKIGGEKLVAKPFDGEGGAGVIIGSADEVRAKVTSFPYLLQAFIDTSGGIPGIAKSLHDFRIVVIKGEPVLSYVREPKKGSFLANESRGGKITEVGIEKIPQDALAIFKEVDAVLKRFPNRVYSVDMGRDKDGTWKLIELNAMPGLDPCGKYEGAERYVKGLATMLMNPDDHFLQSRKDEGRSEDPS